MDHMNKTPLELVKIAGEWVVARKTSIAKCVAGNYLQLECIQHPEYHSNRAIRLVLGE